jgi:diguanylate cyclase (GGDEF)-like protein
MENVSAMVATGIQWFGVALVTALCLLLTRSTRRDWLALWSAGWVCLALSLPALEAAFRWRESSAWGFTVYFLGEYAFGWLLVGGCRRFVGEATMPRRVAWAIVPTVALALALPRLFADFNAQFAIHAAVLAGFFAAALLVLRRTEAARRGPGFRVMRLALVLLLLDFAHYVPVFAYAARVGPLGRFAYLGYTSYIDLLMEVLLGFGMVMVTLEQVQHELKLANERLATLARVDPLTETLNRRAFDAHVAELASRAGKMSGTVALVDINGLKQINDLYGHAAGDAVIRALGTAIRSLIRADDLLFRWGGDEFLLLVWGVPEAEVARRLDGLNGILNRVQFQEATVAEPLSASLGFAFCSGPEDLDRAIAEADTRMYAAKRALTGAGV